MICITRIDDPEDPRVAPFRDIRERDLVGRENRFIAEGKVVIATMLQSKRFTPESLLLLDSRLEGMAEVLADLPAHVPVYVASRSVMDRIAGFPIHRGILGLGKRGPRLAPLELIDRLPERAMVLVLAGISNHDNVGSIFRNAAAFGANAVFLDRQCCDPLYRKSIRVSVGASLRVPFAQGGQIEELSEALSNAGFAQLAFSPAGRLMLRDIRPAARIALIFGSEGQGLPPEFLNRIETVAIPMAPGFDSLNVAASSAIALHHCAARDSGIG